MEARIESRAEKWKDHSTKHRGYVLGRSCTYESTPLEGNLLPRLIVRVFVHEPGSGDNRGERKVGEISISVDRDRWKNIAGLGDVVEADKQLRKAAHSARDGNWTVDPLPKFLKRACQVIQGKITKYESADQLISGEFSI